MACIIGLAIERRETPLPPSLVLQAASGRFDSQGDSFQRRLRDRIGFLVVATSLVAASHAIAQSQASPPAAAPAQVQDQGKTVEGVTVIGASQNDFRSSIDRKSYSVANDLAATTGSISDALRNIPSVEVGVTGTVSLRGDTNVTILVDGKTSGLFRGAGAAQALQSMPADSIERIEVITNPSAQFSPEGAAGIINLITKKTRKAGASGSVRLNIGNDGRVNAGLTGAYNSNKLTLTADLGARTEPSNATVADARTLLDGDGRTLGSSTTRYDNTAKFNPWNAHGGIDYDATNATRLSAEAHYNRASYKGDSIQHFDGLDADGNSYLAFGDLVLQSQDRTSSGIQASVSQKLDGDDHVLTLNVSREGTDETRDLVE